MPYTFFDDASCRCRYAHTAALAVAELPELTRTLNDRMHELLERNTEGTLGEIERAELETLVQVAQVVQILAMAAQGVTAA